jgi:hypothetical protein
MPSFSTSSSPFGIFSIGEPSISLVPIPVFPVSRPPSSTVRSGAAASQDTSGGCIVRSCTNVAGFECFGISPRDGPAELVLVLAPICLGWAKLLDRSAESKQNFVDDCQTSWQCGKGTDTEYRRTRLFVHTYGELTFTGPSHCIDEAVVLEYVRLLQSQSR